MDNIKYEVRREFLPVRTALEKLSSGQLEKVEEAIRTLGADPRPEEYRCRKIESNVYKIWVAIDGVEVAVIYEVRDSERLIDLINIKQMGPIALTLRWLDGLSEFTP